MKSIERKFTYIIPAIVLALFIGYACLSARANSIMIIAGIVSVVIFTTASLNGLHGMVTYWSDSMWLKNNDDLGERSKYRLHPTGKILLFALVAQLLLILLIYGIFIAINGYSSTVFNCYSEIFMKSNPHGIGSFAHIASQRLTALPLLIDVVNSLMEMTGKAELVAFVFNTAIVCVFCVVLYEFTLLDHDKKIAVRAVILLFISPAIVYLLMPMSGTVLFMLLALLSLYHTKKGSPIAGSLFAIMTFLLNVFGALLIVPLVMEGIKLCIKNRSAKVRCSVIISMSLMTCIIVAVLLLGMNGIIHFPAKELIFKDGFVFFFEGIGKSVSTWINSNSMATAMFTAVVAQLIAGFCMILSSRRLNASNNVFIFLWYAIAPVAIYEPSMAVYCVCACPLLPVMEAVCVRKGVWSAVRVAIMIASLIIFVASIFVKRLV